MTNKSHIYTRTGDQGYTSLAGGKRTTKTHPRIEAYGTVDELNAFIAILLTTVDDPDDRALLLRIQSRLFDIGGRLATEGTYPPFPPDEVDRLEAAIDHLDAQVPPLKAFVLPGGATSASWAHVCRTVCRRAERAIYRMENVKSLESALLQYINRLSDYFFLLARKENIVRKIDEITWKIL
jgi:cob(I)alamin adenosyltransferase